MVAAAADADAKDDDLALHKLGEVLLDRKVDVGGRGHRREPAREGVEVAHLVFPFARELGLPLHRIGEMARHQRDHHEQHEIEDLGRAGEEVGVERRVPRVLVQMQLPALVLNIEHNTSRDTGSDQ